MCINVGRWFVHPPRNPKDIHNTAKIVSTVHQNTNKLIQKFEINQETCTLLESLCRELAQLNARTARCSWQPSRFERQSLPFWILDIRFGMFWDTLSLSRFHLRSCINTNHASCQVHSSSTNESEARVTGPPQLACLQPLFELLPPGFTAKLMFRLWSELPVFLLVQYQPQSTGCWVVPVLHQ